MTPDLRWASCVVNVEITILEMHCCCIASMKGSQVRTKNRFLKGTVAVGCAVILALGVGSPAQAAFHDFGSNPPGVNCNGTQKRFNTVRSISRDNGSALFLLSKAAGYQGNWINRWGIYNSKIGTHLELFDGGGHSKYLMQGFIKGTKFQMVGKMSKTPAGKTCYNKWGGTLTF